LCAGSYTHNSQHNKNGELFHDRIFYGKKICFAITLRLRG
jgi:hypothetical protein